MVAAPWARSLADRPHMRTSSHPRRPAIASFLRRRCEGNDDDWATKCAWDSDKCSGCSDCTEGAHDADTDHSDGSTD